ncbi:EF-hand domain-containing protein [Bradyrhizobium sp. WSM1417]|uniref:EF-hand domain-containing protein n=1 Tax=Bradyrhizobium sp. WSM1417 TaxID=754500 RepID=UPI00047F8418|nr:EF-hand domain-containing protein [Bradyrhizobium sp. WSM1417]
MRVPSIAVALLSAVLSYPTFAQSSSDHEVDHPGQNQVSPPAEAELPAGPSAERKSTMRGGYMMGMMGRGMNGQGMTGADGMVPAIMFRMIFALMDADGDGTISLPEFQVAHERIFKAMDSNKDGKLTLDEIQAFMRGTKNSAPQQ